MCVPGTCCYQLATQQHTQHVEPPAKCLTSALLCQEALLADAAVQQQLLLQQLLLLLWC
jgi:hypothetical protein